jgi:recombinational DNA repair protein RecT
MSQYFIIGTFELYEGQLENWKKLSKEIDIDMAEADGFISRDSGIVLHGYLMKVNFHNL